VKTSICYLSGILVFVLSLAMISCDSFTGTNPVSETGENVPLQGNNPPSKAAGATVHQNSDIFTFPEGVLVESASASLLRNPSGVRMNIHTNDLEPGDTFTIWWVIFNNPDECENPVGDLTECSEPDLFNPDTGPSILYAAGNIVGGNGKSNFSGALQVNDLDGCQPPWDDFDLCGDGLEDPYNAEIHLVVRTHGPKIPGMVNDQINTFAGGCTPESSFGAGDGPNECADLQFAAFLAAE